jgi:hypothetical protein
MNCMKTLSSLSSFGDMKHLVRGKTAMIFQSGKSSKVFAAVLTAKILAIALTAGSFIILPAGSAGAHTVPACCIAPHPEDDNFDPTYPYPMSYCEDRKNALQASTSNGGNTVRENNKHCDFDASHGGPKK